VKTTNQLCWWCAKPTHEQELTELWNRRNESERRFVLLCKPCATDRDKTVWLGWRKDRHAHTP
jgi:hypothetical protein